MNYTDYFNGALRNSLGYPERFTVEIGHNRVTLTPDRESHLLKLIKSDSKLKEQLLRVISDNIKRKDPSAYDIHFSSHGHDLEIKYSSKLGGREIIQLETGIHSIIASYLDDLNDYCKSGLEFEKICRNPEFWIFLIREEYPEYFIEVRGGYNWEHVYHGLVWYDETKKLYEDYLAKVSKTTYSADIASAKRRLHGIPTDLDRYHHETFMYLLNNNKLQLTQDQIEDILSSTKNVTVVKNILGKYPIDILTLSVAWSNQLYNTKISELFLNYHSTDSQGNPVEITKEDIENIMDSWLDHDEHALTPDEFQLYFNKLYPAGSSDDMITFLLQSHVFDSATIDYVYRQLSHLPEPKDLYNLMVDAIRGIKTDVVRMLWRKYRHQLLKDVDDLRETVNAEFTTVSESDFRDELLNILKN
jgi:hypothetical protein